ncbi:hypothetical protein SY88_13180 [Clostridiales bacterium PH28_bin88]|nr:hypothetical protein SY88_13180 [Clostridiales bacterium PH28_bin88]
MKVFKIPKATQTYADTLFALGVADLVLSLAEGDVTVKDAGSGYEIIPAVELDQESVSQMPISPGYPYLKVKQDSNAPQVGEVIDYDQEKQIEQIYREFVEVRQKGKNSGRNQPVNLDVEDEPPRPRHDLQVLKTINALRASDAYSKMYRAVEGCTEIGILVGNRLQHLAELSTGSYAHDEPATLTSTASTLQLFNPISGKGVHRPKPDGTSVAQFPKKWVDWFQEWMKYRGMQIGMSAYRVGDDTKVMVLVPGDIPVNEVRALREDLLRQRLWGNIHLEINASLLLAEMLVKHSAEYAEGYSRLKMRNRRPNDILKGVQAAYFKSMGNVSAVMNISFLSLPGWLPVSDRASAEALLDILEEHRVCLRALDESHSDEVRLLAQYRDFLSGGILMDFLYFLADFAPFIMRRLEQRKWVKRFSVINLRRMVMACDVGLKEIVDNEGFQNLATAIRKATVNAQYRKAQGNNDFEIHYGLAQEWKRKVKFKTELVAAICDFVQQYNEENARHVEQKRERRKSITKEDLDQVIGMIEDKGPELVGMLLLAYGYATKKQEACDLQDNEGEE